MGAVYRGYGSDLNCEEVYQKFFNAVLKGGLQPLARVAYELLGRPIAIGDETGAKMLQVPEEPLENSNWNELFKNGTINQDDYLSVHKDLASGAIPYNEPVLVHDRFLDTGNQVITIFERMGSILTFATVIYGDDTPTKDDMKVIAIFSQAVQSEIVRMHQLEKSQEKRLALVLSETDISSPDYLVAVSSLGKRYPAPYYLLYLEETNPNEHHVLSRVCRSLNAGAMPVVAAYLESAAAILLYGAEGECPRILTQIADLLSKYPVRAGESTAFQGMDLARDYCFQARMTLLAGTRIDPAKAYYRYDDYVPYQMCAATSLGGSMEAFVHPTIMAIARYDAEHKSEWIKTIGVYTFNMLNKGATAKALNVHPNTLTYRLERIKELFGVDCSDPQFLSTFYTSAAALRFGGMDILGLNP